jgi:hypothetical protein
MHSKFSTFFLRIKKKFGTAVSSLDFILGDSGVHWNSNESRLLSGDLEVHIGTAARSLGYNSKGFRCSWTSSEEPGLQFGGFQCTLAQQYEFLVIILGASNAYWHNSKVSWLKFRGFPTPFGIVIKSLG